MTDENFQMQQKQLNLVSDVKLGQVLVVQLGRRRDIRIDPSLLFLSRR